MTTINTIIEEEKKGFEELYPPVHIGYDGNETDYFRREKFLEILTSAMQRAYEAGVQDTVGEIEKRIEKEFIKENIGTYLDDQEKGYNQSLTSILSILKDITSDKK